VKVGCVGRGGRLPWVVADMAMIDVPSLNGTAPVNICVDVK
jgi:hypothetical protein